MGVLLITNIKLGSTFLISQFYINSFFKPYRLDRNRNGGGVLIYICKDMPSKELDNHLPNDTERMFIQLNLRKTKGLLFKCYHPPSRSDNYFFYHIKNNLDKFSQNYSKTC